MYVSITIAFVLSASKLNAIFELFRNKLPFHSKILYIYIYIYILATCTTTT